MTLRAECVYHCFRIAIDHGQIGANRAIRFSFVLFPILQRAAIERESGGEPSLRKPGFSANRFYVNGSRQGIAFEPDLAPQMRDGFFGRCDQDPAEMRSPTLTNRCARSAPRAAGADSFLRV